MHDSYLQPDISIQHFLPNKPHTLNPAFEKPQLLITLVPPPIISPFHKKCQTLKSHPDTLYASPDTIYEPRTTNSAPCAKIQSYAQVFLPKFQFFQKFLPLILQGLTVFLILGLRENSAQMRKSSQLWREQKLAEVSAFGGGNNYKPSKHHKLAQDSTYFCPAWLPPPPLWLSFQKNPPHTAKIRNRRPGGLRPPFMPQMVRLKTGFQLLCPQKMCRQTNQHAPTNYQRPQRPRM